MKLFIFLVSTLLLTNVNYSADLSESLSEENNCASCDHTKHSKPYMISYSVGYAWLESNDNHMQDDSAPYIGIHIMSHKPTYIFNKEFNLAAGAHKTWTNDPHFGIMLGLMYALNENTSIGFMPGQIWMKHSDSHNNQNMNMNMNMNTSNKKEWDSEYANHIEIQTKLNLFNRVINTSISTMLSKSHTHYSVGFNLLF